MSKQGKKFFNVKEIQSAFDRVKKLGSSVIIDGELAGKTWKQSMTLFRSSVADVSLELKDRTFWVFDLIQPHRLHEPWQDRNEQLLELIEKINHPQIKVLPSMPLQSFDEFQKEHEMHLASGCDGSMLKSIFGQYEFKRSKLWLKVKPIHEVDCKIVGFKPGKKGKKYEGILGSILVKIPIAGGKWSKKVTGISGMTDIDRHYIWKHRDELLGKIVEVKYRTISDKGRLIEGRIHRLRDDK